MKLFFVCFVLLGSTSFAVEIKSCYGLFSKDPHIAFEEVHDVEVLDWARAQNAKTFDRLKSDPRYEIFYKDSLERANSQDRIAYGVFYRNSEIVRNFWNDAANPQGVLRQTTQTDYFSGTPTWETVFDVDALSKAEGKTFVFKGTSYQKNNPKRGLMRLSDGGKDAIEYREFDFVKKEFVKDGFYLPESKSSVSWFNHNTLLVASAFGENELTDSGYPRVLKVWKRHTPFTKAKTIFEVEKSDMSVSGSVWEISPNRRETFVFVTHDFYNHSTYWHSGNEFKKLNVPSNSSLVDVFKDQMFLQLKSLWQVNGQTFEAGSIVTFNFDEFMKTGWGVKLFLPPVAKGTFKSLSTTKDYVYVETLEDVQSKIYQYSLVNGRWSKRELPVSPFGTAGLISAPEDKGFILYYEQTFLTPSITYKLNEKTLQKEVFQSSPKYFDADLYKVEQRFATSRDGTRVPYFMVYRKDLKMDGTNPTLQYGYGGFEISEEPSYIPGIEATWLRQGGVYVLTNIRGGGEFGPKWHQAALKKNRHKAFQDFIAISEDLIARNVTSPDHLGIEGGSNGGLLTGTVVTMRPDLYNAAIISVPLLDMLRFHKLPAGASWIGEYGNPEVPDEHEYLKTYSPYQNIRPEFNYPEVFVMTSTADDRVHPGHARKFTRELEVQGKPFYYYENIEGGHGGSANVEQAVESRTLERVYLWKKLKGD